MERQPLPTGNDQTAIIPQLGEDHFDVVMRGYDRRQVDERVARLRSRAEELERRLEAAQTDASDAWREVESFRQSATHAAPTAQQLGDRITGLLRLADEEATARRSAAKVDADRLTKEAEERTKQALSEAEERARKVLAEAEERSRRSDIDARRRIDSLERHHTDLVQRMTRMRDVLVDLLGQERAASEAAKPAPSSAPAGQPGTPGGKAQESVRIVAAQSSPAPATNGPAEPVQPGAGGPARPNGRDEPQRPGQGGPPRPQPPSTQPTTSQPPTTQGPITQGQGGQRRS
jgi:cell division septum initiation protein DivIVA